MIPPRIKDVKVLDDFCLEITYSTNEKRKYDMNKLLSLDCYKKLRDANYFVKAKSVETTIEWPNGEDIDPNELYDSSISID